MKYEMVIFNNKTIKLDGNVFNHCLFKNSKLKYSGGPIPIIGNCAFENCEWLFEKEAENTLKFMQALYHGAGEGGRQLIEQAFDNIRTHER